MNTNRIIEAEVKGLQVSKLFESKTSEALLISLEKGKIFPKHTSPKEALLVVVEGHINFYIENKMIALEQHEVYTFPAATEHYVTANQNSKFLIFR